MPDRAGRRCTSRQTPPGARCGRRRAVAAPCGEGSHVRSLPSAAKLHGGSLKRVDIRKGVARIKNYLYNIEGCVLTAPIKKANYGEKPGFWADGRSRAARQPG